MCMGMRRFTRLTNAFSKKLENHMHAISFCFVGYFVKIHKTIKTTAELGGGRPNRPMAIEDIVTAKEKP